jgi:uncharacterized protein (TIGR01370 family)
MATIFSDCSSRESTGFIIEDYTPFGVSYVKLSPEQVAEYELVIVEPDFYTKEEMTSLRQSGTKILAYVTLGEIDPNRWYFPILEETGFLGTNKNWNSKYLNLEDPQVRQIILDRIIPEIVSKGPDGLFLDTIDAVSPVTERGYLKPFMVELIKEIRNKYPEMLIIQNAGLFLIEDTKDYVDAFLTEALASSYSFSSREYLIRSDEDLNDRLEYLNHFVELSGKPFFIIDFAETESHREQLRTKLDTLNRPYFISNIGLSELPEDPESVTNSLKQE